MLNHCAVSGTSTYGCLLCAKHPLAMSILQLLENGGSARREPSGHSSQVCWKPALCSSTRTTPPSSLEWAVGGTRCSGRIQKDAICEGNLLLESRDSQWWSWPTPRGCGGTWGGQAAKGVGQAKSRVYSVLKTTFLLHLEAIRNNSKHLLFALCASYHLILQATQRGVCY